MPLTLSVIIPALNEEDNIEAAVKSVWEGAAGREGDAQVMEVIVVDGGSEDATVQRAIGAGARVIDSKLRGRGVQMNRGAEEACGNTLLFLHADCSLPHDFLDDINKALDSCSWGAFPRAKVLAPGLSFRLLEVFIELRTRVYSLPYGDQGIFVKKAVFEKAGGYSVVELLEDYDLVVTLHRLVGSPSFVFASRIKMSARRWIARGVLRTTIRNQYIILLALLGVDRRYLKELYYGKKTQTKEE